MLQPHIMQLVVMAAVMVVAGARQGCRSYCHLTNIPIEVETCGRVVHIDTSLCAGQCYTKDPVFSGNDDMPEQRVCNGNWTYRVKQIPGCPVSITYPVATHCECTTCNTGNTHCGRYTGEAPSCLPS